MSENSPWWRSVEPAVEKLARAIVSSWLPAETWVLPYGAATVPTPQGSATLVPPKDLVPLWTCYVGLARLALEGRDKGELEAELDIPTEQEQNPVSESDKPPGWRGDVGLE